mmetsp:Transcript_33195/g.94022  ORF Transcript_33195/g.94022 Transcript_33195/m.94022 type:complete len:997 (-) Transcript_33195:125-3115(-)
MDHVLRAMNLDAPIEAMMDTLNTKGVRYKGHLKMDPVMITQNGQQVEVKIPEIVPSEGTVASTKLKQGKGQMMGDKGIIMPRRLEVFVFTSDIENAASDDSAYIYLRTKSATEGPIPLNNDSLSKDNTWEDRGFLWNKLPAALRKLHERGTCTIFEIETKIINDGNRAQKGRILEEPPPPEQQIPPPLQEELEEKGDHELIEIVLGKEASLRNWHVLKVIILDKWSDKAYYFPCEQWLGNSRIALGNELRLFAQHQDVSEQFGRVKYMVTVKTDDCPGAGCEANAFIAIYGDRGCTGKKWLGTKRNPLSVTSSCGKQPLTRGEENAFLINGFDVGILNRVRIGHDNSGLGDTRWKLLSVVVQKYVHLSSGQWVEEEDENQAPVQYIFAFNNWLGYNSQNTGLCEQTLYVMSGKNPEERTLKKYEITINTSDLPAADYEYDACIELFGTFGKSQLITIPGPFKRGKDNIIEQELQDLGELRECMMYAKKFGDAWHMQDIYVQVTERDKASSTPKEAYTFNCDRWINVLGQAKSLLLLAHDVSAGKRQQFKILVYTSKDYHAGTHDSVFIALTGTEDKTRLLHLKASGNAFRRGSVAQFFRSLPPLGKLRSVVIAIDGKKTGSWKPELIEVVDVEENKVYMFPCSEMLKVKRNQQGERKMPKKTLRLLQINHALFAKPNIKCRYKAVMYTSSEANAETTSAVSMVLSGDQGDTEKVIVKGGTKRFNRGQMDATFFEANNVGDIYQLRLALEARVPTSWKCTHVHIVNTRTGAQAVFVPKATLATTTGTERVLVIPAEGKEIPRTIKEFTIVVQTGWARDSNLNSTNADVSIEITGMQRTVVAALEPKGKEVAFIRGSLNIFQVKNPSPGQIESAVVKIAPKRKGLKWDLLYVEVLDKGVQDGFGSEESGVGDVIGKILGSSSYLENPYGPIDVDQSSKRRIKKAPHPKGFKSLYERMEASGFDRDGNKNPDGEEKKGKDQGVGLPKPGLGLNVLKFLG